MNRYDYLIIGGGMTADAAVRGIREIDTAGTIGILSAETDAPYKRPPLSKGLWSGKKTVDDIGCDTESQDVTLITGRTAVTINREEKIVIDDGQNAYGYGYLLLATGGSPRRLPFDDERVIYYRTLADYHALRGMLPEYERFAVIGGGFIGSEMAAVLATQGKEVSMIFPEAVIGGGIFPTELGQLLTEYYQERGVDVLTGSTVSGMESDGHECVLHFENGSWIDVDGVVAGLGIVPNIRLAEEAGLEVDNGIVVDKWLKTTDPSIYAAGDVANFYNPSLCSRMRVEHEDNALTMGGIAGHNMAGKCEPYDHLPFFYSDLFDVGYEAVGHLDASCEKVGVWTGLHEKAVWAYTLDGQVRGMLFWNLFGQVDAGRALIGAKETLSARELEARIIGILEAAKSE